MTVRYFRHFPTLKYSGQAMTNITKRIRFKENFISSPFAYLPLTVKEGERAEEIAYLYYGDTSYVWMIYLANDIVDPYWQWPLTQQNLDRFIEDQYLYACAECAIGRPTTTPGFFNEMLIKTALSVLTQYRSNIRENVPLVQDAQLNDIYSYITNHLSDPYIQAIGARISSIVTNLSVITIAISENIAKTDFPNEVGGFSLDDAAFNYSVLWDFIVTKGYGTKEYANSLSKITFGTDMMYQIIENTTNFQEYVLRVDISDALLQLLIKSFSKERLKLEFKVLNWSQLSLDSITKNIMYYVDVADESVKMSVDSYQLNLGDQPLDPDFEASRWRAVRIYEYEFIRNENNRHIQIIDKKYASKIETEFKRLMND